MPNVVVARDNGSRRVMFACVGESRTEQAHRDEVDINKIVARYQRTGVLPVRSGVAQFGDFSQIGDYHEALDQVMVAERMFHELPSGVRRRFANDPGKLIQFLSDPGNLAEAVSLGLVSADALPADPAAVVVPHATSVVPDRDWETASAKTGCVAPDAP